MAVQPEQPPDAVLARAAGTGAGYPERRERPVNSDWLLVETLGDQPVVVAEGRQMKNFVPLTAFLRRNPSLAAIQTAIAETVETGTGMASITPKNKRVIRTEPVQMSDGRIHGVHVWCGPPDVDPPERPLAGALKDANGEASVTPEFLANLGHDPGTESLTGRTLVEIIPTRKLSQDQARALSWLIDPTPGQTFAANLGFEDEQGKHRRVGFCVRIMLEAADDGTEYLTGRSMNILEAVSDSPLPPDHLAQRTLTSEAQPGVHRAIVNIDGLTLLKWLDDPCPYYNWRDKVAMHPEDQEYIAARMATELETGPISAVLRLPGLDGGWTPMHLTVNRIELDDGVFGGLVAMRLPTEAELADSGLEADGEQA